MASQTMTEGARPFSVRLTKTEKAALKEKAGGLPLGLYLREIALGHTAQRAKRQTATPNQELIARVLATLGKSGLSENLERIVRQAEAGTLYCDQALLDQLRGACAEVRTMRALLMDALGKYAPEKELRPFSAAAMFGKAAGQAVRR